MQISLPRRCDKCGCWLQIQTLAKRVECACCGSRALSRSTPHCYQQNCLERCANCGGCKAGKECGLVH